VKAPARPQWLAWTATASQSWAAGVRGSGLACLPSWLPRGRRDLRLISLTLPLCPRSRRHRALVPGRVVAEDFPGGAGPEVPVEYLDAVPADQAGVGDSAGVAELEQFVAKGGNVAGQAH